MQFRNLPILILVFLLLGMEGFSQNYTVQGDATTYGGCNCFRLNPDDNDKGGAAYQNNTINLNNSFDYTFSVFLGCNNGSGADGICFVLSNNIQALGAKGGGLGYGGLAGNSLCAEFDTYQNGGEPSYQHTALESGGSTGHNVQGPVSILPSQGNVDDCASHTVRIVWDVNAQTYSVYFDGNLRLSYLGNIVTAFFGGNPIVNWGWSGSTGGGTNEQRFCVISNSNWQAGTNYQSCSKVMQFKDISTTNVGSVQSWAWNFGEPASGAANTSNLQSPTHTYASNGTYTVTLTITDISGCANTYSHPVTINAPITLTPTLTQPLCNGGATGNITTVTSGGFGASTGYYLPIGYDYTWNDGTKGSSHVGLQAGTVTLTVTDGVCSSTATYTLNQPPALTAVTTHTDASCGLSNGTANITISGGTLPYSGINWGLAHPGAAVTGLGAGTYIADFIDANGCSSLLQYKEVVAQLPCGYNLTTSKTDVVCFGASTGSATLTVTGGTPTITITWTKGGVPAGSGSTISGLTAGNYDYNYSDGAGKVFTGTVTVNQPPTGMTASLATVNTSCSYLNNGSALASVTAGGVSPYNYAWSGGQPNAPTANSLSPGAITVTVTDSKSCTATATGSVAAQPPILPNVTKIDDSCYLSKTGSASVNATGGNPGYTYVWSNTAIGGTAYDLGIGTYTVTVTDKNSCTVTASTTISQPTQLTYTLTHNNVKCFGGNTGDATITPAGGNGGYTYNWSNTATINNPTGLVANKYYVTAYDAKNCKVTDSVTITEPTKFVVQEDSVNVKCKGLPTGSITLTPSGGTTPYQVCNWGGGITGLTRTLLGAGTYNYSILDANSCPLSGDINITEPALSFSLSHVQTDVKCFGDATGSITLTQSGGTTPYATPQWLDLAVGLTRNGLAAGTYIAIDSDANGCLDSLHILITQPNSAFAAAKASTNVLCNGGTSGTATLTLSGGTTPYGTVTWSDAGSGTSRTGLAVGQYGYTVSDANLCKDTGTIVITEPTKFVVQEDSVNVKCKGLPTGSITLTPSGGTTPYGTVTWGDGPTGLTRSNLASNLYTYTVADGKGCPISGDINITEPALSFSLSHVQTDVKCFGDATGSITLTQSGGTTPYATPQWLDLAVGLTRNGLAAGTYIAIDSDANGCLDSLHILITQPASGMVIGTSFTSASCSYKPDGSATATVTSGGSGPFTFTWSNTFTENNVTTSTATALNPNTYTVTVLDQGGCTVSASTTVGSPSAVSAQITVTDVDCFGNTNGGVSVVAGGGTGPTYNFVWSANAGAVGNNSVATSLGAATYNITVTDGNNCELDTFATVSQPLSALSFQNPVTAKNISCNGGNDGSIQYVVSGGTSPYSFIWSGTAAGSLDLASNLVAGTYDVTITDKNSCSITNSVVLSEPTAISILSQTQTNVSCNLGTDGTATVNASGGTPGYTYTWNPNAGSGNIVGSLSAGSYSVTIKDLNQCSISTSFNISEPSAISASSTQIDVLCNGVNTGAITVNANGGTPSSTGYTYNWNPNVSSSNAVTSIGAGTYSIDVSDSLACSTEVNVTVTEPSILLPTVVSTIDEPCFGDSKGEVQLGASGGTPVYQYEISPDGTNFTPSTNGNSTGLLAGNYTARVTDANGCAKTIPFAISEPSQIAAIFTNDSVKCFGESNGSIAATAFGGSPNYTYNFSNGQTNSNGALTSLPAGAYSVTVTDSKGCFQVLNTTVYQPDSLEIIVNPTDATVNLGQSVQLQASSNYSAITYQWTPSYGLSCTDCDAPVSTTYQSITYTLIGTISPNGKACTASVKIPVTVIPNYNMYIPNAFTPNGDGINDFFEIFGNKAALKFLEVQVFDRWGEKVFDSNDINFKWDGVYKAAQLNPGTFVYQIKAVFLDNHSEDVYKGSLLLLR